MRGTTNQNVTSLFPVSPPTDPPQKTQRYYKIYRTYVSHSHLQWEQCDTVLQWNIHPHSHFFLFHYPDSINAWLWKSFLLFKCQNKSDFDKPTKRITGKRMHTSTHWSLTLCHFATKVITQITVFIGNMKTENSQRHEVWSSHGSQWWIYTGMVWEVDTNMLEITESITRVEEWIRKMYILPQNL